MRIGRSRNRSPTTSPRFARRHFPQIVRRRRMKIPSLLLLATVALVPLSAVADQLLVKFDGGIGVDPVSTATTPNIVRGVQPPGLAWAIADLKAEVIVDGRIKSDGRGLVCAGGNPIGTAPAVTPPGGTTASPKRSPSL